MAKEVLSDDEFNKQIEANKFVLAIFMDSDTEMDVSETCLPKSLIPILYLQASIPELAKMLKQVSYIKVDPSKTPKACEEYDIAEHELPTFIFLEVQRFLIMYIYKCCTIFRIQSKWISSPPDSPTYS